jgi:hypothetical protein
MIVKTKLAQAMAVAMLTVGATSGASAHVMYNTFVGAGDSGTDGWNYGGVGNPSATVSPGWTGTASPTTLPFGYTGNTWLNWAVAIHHNGVMEVSDADAGFDADLDTNKGSWYDNNATGFGTPQGWAHNAEVGLIKSDINGTVTLNLTNVDANPANQWSNFGISVFTGMDGAGGAVNHHSDWNVGGTAANPGSVTSNTPFGFNGLTYLTHDATVDSVNGLTFNVVAGQVYTVILGGQDFGSVFGPTADYKLTLTTVPVPGAVWLFGSAMAGLMGFGRRNKKIAA